MALWGNSDAVSTLGTANLRVVNDEIQLVGSATSFGNPGFAKTGDIIELGFPKNTLGVGTYYGSAVIVGIASTTTLTIGSTIGLTDYVFNASTGVSGIDTIFQVREAPIFAYQIPTYSENANHFANEVPSQTTILVGTAASAVGVGTSAVYLDLTNIEIDSDRIQEVLEANTDSIVNNGNNIKITGFGTFIVGAGSSSGVGFSTIFVDTTQIPAIFPERLSARLANNSESGGFIGVTGYGATTVSLASTIPYNIGVGSAIEFRQESRVAKVGEHPKGVMLGLESGVTAAIADGDTFNIQRLIGGFEAHVYSVDDNLAGISTNATDAGGFNKGIFRTSAGWVGVQTYIDNTGNLRVKKEVLCAMSGITTGNYPVYDGNTWGSVDPEL
tara:strand:- start:96 stop:1253 length:1158 start_codon:yes stop_codon:yes gene_type:complete